MDVWSVILTMFPVPAGKGEQKENECSKHHTAPTKVERQVIGLCPVKEPPCKVRRKTDSEHSQQEFLADTEVNNKKTALEVGMPFALLCVPDLLFTF